MIHCIAIDDEPLALDIIENYVNKIPELKLIGRFTSPLDAMNSEALNKADLLFLDIRMSELSGIQFLKSLKNPPLVIFTTAYDSYALESYELDVLDYLLKPIPFERFVKAVNKAKEYLSFQNQKQEGEEVVKDFIFVRSEYQLIRVNLNDLLYIEGLKDYVKIYSGPKPILTHQNLKTIEGKLPSNQFIRVHKSFIVSLKKIESVQKNSIKVAGLEIPLGDNYRDTLYKYINDSE